MAGTDACDFCRMGVADVRYGAEVVAHTGRVYVFDAVECAASWMLTSPLAQQDKGVWVADFSTGNLVDARTALFVKGGTLHSPMGRSITAFAPSLAPAALATRYGGEVLRWDEVVAFIRAQGIPESHPTATSPSAATFGGGS
ncbi:MAG: nitrous oxide reductase accessory protein NosL [Gemmatimonadaceae bacterium]